MTEPPSSLPFHQSGDPYDTPSTQADPEAAADQATQLPQHDASGWTPPTASAMESPNTVNAYYTNGGPGSFPDDEQPATSNSSHFSQHSSPGNNSNSNNGDPYYSGGSQRSTLDGGDDSGGPGSHIHFVYANERRFQDFHALFRSVPEDERLIEDYGCALQKEILVQGRLYISENHVCFNANIFGWVTNLVIAFSEITAIEKRLTAFVIPNAISIVTTTNTKGHFFASFLSRDSAYDLLMAAWRKSFPCAANAPTNGNNAYFRQNRSNLTLENGNGSGGGAGTGLEDNDDGDDAQSFISARGPSADSRRNRHRRTFSNNSQNWTADEAEYDDMDDPERLQTGSTLRRRGSRRAVVRKILKDVISTNKADEDSSVPSTPSKRTGRVRSVSELPPPPSHFDPGRRDSTGSAQTSLENILHTNSSPKSNQSHHRAGTETLMPPNTHPGHKKHAPKSAPSAQKPSVRKVQPTTCACSKEGKHYAATYMNETFPGSIEAIWKLLFESDFTSAFLTSEVMKGADLQDEGWKANPDNTQTKITRYTKWLGMPIGPKTTKAILTAVCEHKDFDEYVTCVTTTSTPDVPSGNCFTTKNRTCLTWAGPNQVRVVVTGGVEFSKSSWFKGQIEKGAADGMTTHYQELNQAVRKYIASHPAEFADAGGAPTTQGAGSSAASLAATAGAAPTAVPVVNGSASPGSPRPSGTAKKAAGARIAPPTQNGDTAKAPNGSVTPKTSANATSGTSSLVQQLLSIKKTIAQGLSEMVGGSIASSSAGGGATSEGGLLNPLLLVVLVLVMAMNIYIWWQISSVTSQMQRVQNEILDYHWKTTHHDFMHQQRQQRSSPRNPASYYDAFEDRNGASPPSSSSSAFNDQDHNDFYDNTNDNNAHGFWSDEEEAMWTWLTEREAMIRQAHGRRTAANAASSRGFPSPPPSSSSTSPSSSSSGDKDALLQARILELQQQLEALEQRARMLERQEDQASSELGPSS
ncbi:hypothetical protein DFQ27_008924 [Actinomortierella ambigua]|uniref:VASt domain-containing protein n=1 Tax=Actinomortierella ambigua TaxID=1343610 RepID=A0A9P6PRJ4_9FUNG|nr:hypothetical protein DFQ27_008924 [Actinomortierella ambigua]